MVEHHFLDQYAGIDSLIHKIDPRIKLICAFAFILVVVTAKHFFLLAGLAIVFIVLILLSHLPLKHVMLRMLVVLPFIGAMTLFIPFTKPGAPILMINLFLFEITATDAGIYFALLLMIRGLLAIGAVIILTSTTKFNDLLKALQDLWVPKIFTALAAFAYRYIFLFVDEMMRMRRAQKARTVNKISWLRRLKMTAQIIGSLFIRTYELGERVYLAMVARGYTGEIRTLTKQHILPKDWALGISFFITLIVLVIMGGGNWLI